MREMSKDESRIVRMPAICTTTVKIEVAMSSDIFDETSLDLIVRVYRGGTGRQHFNYYCIARDPDGIAMGSDGRVLLHKITEENDKLEGYTREVN